MLAAEGRLGGVCLSVIEPSSGCTFVELFHLGGLILTVILGESSVLRRLGEESGVRLWLYLCDDRSGVIVCEPPKGKNDERCRNFGAGSDNGATPPFLLPPCVGVPRPGVLFPAANFFANLRNGEIDRESVLD